MSKFVSLTVSAFISIFLLTCSTEPGPPPIESLQLDRGICVVLGSEGVGPSLQLASRTDFLVYLQIPDAAAVETAQKAFDEAGLFGTRVWVEEGDLDRIHLADNLADVVLAPDLIDSPNLEQEVLRVLRPEGQAFIGRRQLSKPLPEAVDDWSHPYHGPDNNPQSKDQLARAPYLTQFLALPYYAPLTQVAVASNGRVFKAFGNIAFHEREEALLNSLVAFNGYNGTMLWRRKLSPGVMIHRNTMIATPDILYLGDDRSCKKIDTASGRLIDEIAPAKELAGGTFWKWMALENGVLYALLGEQEQKDPVVRQKREAHGWPWNPVTPGFNQPENPWGFGTTLVAIDPESKEILWSHQETEPVDSRALCMKNGRMYLYRHGSYLACLDARDGNEIWRKTPETAADLFEALGPELPRQGWQTNWRTTVYLKCSDEALYFSGPTVDKLLALSAGDGRILWSHPYNNFQLVLRDEGLYAISGETDGRKSLKFDPLTGEILAEFDTHRRGCTRPNGSVDSILYRARGGSTRLLVDREQVHWISPMRAQCHDGITVANGLLYWWPSTCDCQNSIYGLTCVGPAGDFQFDQTAETLERLKKGTGEIEQVQALPESPGDWPTFRADNGGSSTTSAALSEQLSPRWWKASSSECTPTAPVAAGGLIFLGGSDGIVKALDSNTGDLKWKAYTGGTVRFPPVIWNSRCFVGSGDGYVYSFEAATGRLLWRFRAAPEERKIPVYGSLSSTWPVASGVLVENGTVFAAAGIVDYDGIHVYALDAITGEIRWQNNDSGHLNPEAKTGVGVQGHLLAVDGKLYLAGGTSVSPAVYDMATGKCLNDPLPLEQIGSTSLRGQDLYKVGDRVVVGGPPLYGDPRFPVFDPSVTESVLPTTADGLDVVWLNGQKLIAYQGLRKQDLNACVAAPPSDPAWVIPGWGNFKVPNRPVWQYDCPGTRAFARSTNAILLARHFSEQATDAITGKTFTLGRSYRIESIDVRTGRKRPGRLLLEGAPVPWGLAIDSEGRVFVALEGGSVMCFG